MSNDKILNVVTKPEDVEFLPWYGNHFSDKHSFDLCHAYIMNDSTSWDDRKSALTAMGKFGMGIDEECTDQELQSYINEAPENN